MMSFLKTIFGKNKKKAPYNRVYILENEKKIDLMWYDSDLGQTTYSYSYGYENGWLKLCLWGGCAYKKQCAEAEVESIIESIRRLQMRENEVHSYLEGVGGFEPWNYYEEFYKTETVYE